MTLWKLPDLVEVLGILAMDKGGGKCKNLFWHQMDSDADLISTILAVPCAFFYCTFCKLSHGDLPPT